MTTSFYEYCDKNNILHPGGVKICGNKHSKQSQIKRDSCSLIVLDRLVVTVLQVSALIHHILGKLIKHDMFKSNSSFKHQYAECKSKWKNEVF